MSLNENQIKWSIFTAAVFLFPAWFYLIIGGDFFLIVPNLIESFFFFSEGGLPLIFPINCVIWGFFFYLASAVISKRISAKCNKTKWTVLSAALAIIFLSGFAPLYYSNGSNAFEVYKGLWNTYAN